MELSYRQLQNLCIEHKLPINCGRTSRSKLINELRTRGIIGYLVKKPILRIDTIELPQVNGVVYSNTYEESIQIPLGDWSHYGQKVQTIGKGSYGKVVKYSLSNIRQYAIKISGTKELTVDETPSFDFIIETGLLIRSRHPNIVNVLDVVSHINDFEIEVGIVLNLAKSDLLTALREHNFSITENDKITYQILAGISYLHSRHILHRDIKPENILYYDLDDIKISDLGSAKPFLCEPKVYTNEIYTMWYRPPEILLSSTAMYDFPADVWATAVTIWEVYTGDPLFQNPGRSNRSQLDVIFRKLGTPGQPGIWPEAPKYYDLSKFKIYPKQISTITDPIPNNRIADLILSMLNYNPGNRPSIYSVITNSYFDGVRMKNTEHNLTDCSVSHDTRDRRQTVSYDKLSNDKIMTVFRWLSIVVSDKDVNYHIKTYLLTISIFDQSIIGIGPSLDDLQLFGLACLSIAADISERTTLGALEYANLTKFKYSIKKFNIMRLNILKYLKFDTIFTVSYDYYLEAAEFGIGETGTRQRVWNLIKGLLFVATLSSIRLRLFPHDIFRLCLDVALIHYPRDEPIDSMQIRGTKEDVIELLTTLKNESVEESKILFKSLLKIDKTMGEYSDIIMSELDFVLFVPSE